MPCFIRENSFQEFWLLGFEDREHPKRWEFDIRLFFKEQYIFLEIFSHPNTISEDLTILLKWLRAQTIIFVQDEDGESSGW